MIRTFFFLSLILLAQMVMAQNKDTTATDEEQAELNRKQELHYQNLILFSLSEEEKSPLEETFQRSLELNEDQIQSIKRARDQFTQAAAKNSSERGQLYSSLQKGLLNKQVYEQAIKESKAAEEAIKKHFFANVHNLLLPHQQRAIGKRAKRIRMKRIKDEFEVPVIIAREKGLPASEVSRIAKAVNEARKTHYAKLKEVRRKYEEKVLSGMAPEVRRQFSKLNGKLYDYESERVIELTKDE